MLYFCADDYGVSAESNRRIEMCLTEGALNKVSVLPNGKLDDYKERLSSGEMALHINLVEGKPLSAPEEIPLLVAEDGSFKRSFIGLFLLTLTANRKRLKAQLYTELHRQLAFWQAEMGDGVPLSIDSHQHACMIPLVFRTLMRVIREENIPIARMRIAAEPLRPYLCTPSLYTSYTVSGVIKQWLLKFFALLNRRAFKQMHLTPAYFLGAMFSGKLDEAKLNKLLPKYQKLAEKNGRDIEVAFHPGCVTPDEELMAGCRKDFGKFYFSPWRNTEYQTVLNFKREKQETKEGLQDAFH